jgi:hypothetical protein
MSKKPKDPQGALKLRVWNYLTTWQSKLRLMDWRINLTVVPKKYANQSGEMSYGMTKVDSRLKCATIYIMDPKEDEMAEKELEATVVHELLHLYFDPYPWGKDESRDVVMEQAVDGVAIALMKLAHPKWKDPRNNVG